MSTLATPRQRLSYIRCIDFGSIPVLNSHVLLISIYFSHIQNIQFTKNDTFFYKFVKAEKMRL